MSNRAEVSAMLTIELLVRCPDEGCQTHIDLLREEDTCGGEHNRDNVLLQQVYQENGGYDGFVCRGVRCYGCKGVFDVKGLGLLEH